MAEGDPRVSVVLPTYNRADRLPRAIESVLEQTYEDLELIVVDDGSTDDTTAVIDSYTDDRLQYVQHDTNRGVSAARNTGIEAAAGSIISFQDSDDEWLPEKLEKQLGVFATAPSKVGVVYTGMWREVGGDRRYLPYDRVDPKEGDISDSIVSGNFVSTQMAAVRRKCFETVGTFDEELSALVDWDLWIRISQRYHFRLVDEALVEAGVKADSISDDRPTIVNARERIVEKHAEKFDRESLANHLFYVGHGAMKVGDIQRGRRYLRRAARTKSDPKYWGTLLLSLSGARPYSWGYNVFKRVTG